MESEISRIAYQFGIEDILTVDSFSEGLIHHTFKVTSTNRQAIIIQAINTHVFQHPEVILSNYQTLYAHLTKKNFRIPAPIATKNGEWLAKDERGIYWRAQEFIDNSFAETGSLTEEKTYEAAYCFAGFAKALCELNPDSIIETIPHFHDLNFRYKQFLETVQHASVERLQKSNEWIALIENKKPLIHFYSVILAEHGFKKRIMHHDCKLTNILFDKTTHRAICPVDLDTTMPGYFFSDIGDMIRSMVPTQAENSVEWNALNINTAIYSTLINGYQGGMQGEFTSFEEQHIHCSGLLMLFMQGLRFLSDYLSNDMYYKISYDDQNLNRARNQFLVLQKLEQFLFDTYGYKIK